MNADFRDKLFEIAQRANAASPRCLNEESTKMFLVLPFLRFLGYDPSDPNEVVPEHHADFGEKYKNRVDFAILKDDCAIIALECKPVGSPLKDDRGQLRSYFNAARTVKMGVLTDGLIWEFYADSDEPNMMDDSAFLVVNLKDIADGKIEDSVLQGLRDLQKLSFDPENIGAEARRKHIFNSVLDEIQRFAEEPDDQMCRVLLQKAGVKHLRQKSFGQHKDIIKQAFREFVNNQIMIRLDLSGKEIPQSISPTVGETDQEAVVPAKSGKILTTETEMFIFSWVRQRLAFLVDDESLFREIDKIRFRDYQGKFVVFYNKERRGRLFDFVEGKEGAVSAYKFIWPDDLKFSTGETVTSNLLDIDADLVGAFKARVNALREG